VKLIYSWEGPPANLSPNCIFDSGGEDAISPLACLLTDDGGRHYLTAVPWLNEGLHGVNLVLCKTVKLFDWSRDAWGAELTEVNAKIYSLYNDNYFELIEINSFQHALSSWLEFIQSEPTAGTCKVIKL
jgi:hypothetical protein